MMIKPIPSPDPARAWQRTVAGDLSPPLVPQPAPPPREAIRGLDVCELESETVFDRLFGELQKPAR